MLRKSLITLLLTALIVFATGIATDAMPLIGRKSNAQIEKEVNEKLFKFCLDPANYSICQNPKKREEYKEFLKSLEDNIPFM